MGLLDLTPDDWLEPYRRAVQNRSPSDGSADAPYDPAPTWRPRSQLLPLSFAGPAGLAVNAAASPSGLAPGAVPLPRPRPSGAPTAEVSWPGTYAAPLVQAPQAGQSAALPSWARPPTGNPFAGNPSNGRGIGWPTPQDLVAHALRMQAVPEAVITAAMNKPELMKQLGDRLYGPDFATAPAAADASWSGRARAAPVVLPPQDGPMASPQPEGNGKSDRLPAGPPIWARPPSGNPFVSYPGGVRGVPGLTTQNLTHQALRNRGVPEPDIAAASNNPELMKQLINQTFGQGSGTHTRTSAVVAPIGNDRAAAVAALRGIPFAGAYVDKGTARLNAAAQPFLETGLSHAGTFAERTAENERTIKGATDQYQRDHPIKTFAGRTLAVSSALGPIGLTALGARALGTAGEALLPSAVKAATTLGLLFAGDAAWRGGDAKDIAEGALYGIGGGGTRVALSKTAGAVAPLLIPIFSKPP